MPKKVFTIGGPPLVPPAGRKPRSPVSKWMRQALARLEFKVDLLLTEADIDPDDFVDLFKDRSAIPDLPTPETISHSSVKDYRKPSSKEPRTGRWTKAYRKKAVRALYK